MLVIPAGEFEMGSKDGGTRELPIHMVKIARPFALGKYPVTQREWRQVMGDNSIYFMGCDDCPVAFVSWDDVQIFIKRLNQLTGKTYRLPSEAEWEYAAKAGSDFNDAGSEDIDAVAWYGKNSGTWLLGLGKTTHAVGQKLGNAWGLYDMSGNVWEWVEDWWNDSYQGAPTDGSAWTTGDYALRVLRGGSYDCEARYMRTAYRLKFTPGFRSSFIGFRLARMLP